MDKYLLEFQYAVSEWYQVDVVILAKSPADALKKAEAMLEDDTAIDYSTARHVGEGEPGATELWAIKKM